MISALNRILTRIASSWPGSSNGGSSIRICLPLSLSVHTLSGSISSGIAFSPHIPSLRRASQNDAARLCSFGDTGPTRLPGRSKAWHDRALEWEEDCRTAVTPCLRVLLQPDEFLTWCRARQVQPDAEARSTFIVEKARSVLWPEAPADDV